MKENFRVVIIDDHPLIREAYKVALELYGSTEDIEFTISILGSIDAVLEKLGEEKFINGIDLVFLDIQLPDHGESGGLSGEDLGIKIRKLRPEVKILISTSLNDNYRVNSILKSVDPDAFLLKGDIDKAELMAAIKAVFSDTPYYSKSILQLLRKKAGNDYFVDEFDRKLLYELSIGTKLKDLPKVLPFSSGGIEKRRRNLKMLFGIEEDGDRSLIIIAKEKGFI